MQKKSFSSPDETMTPPKTRVEVVNIGGATLIRNTFEPGWVWSEHVKPTAGTDSCQTHHVLYVISGKLKAVMEDGTEIEVGPSEVADIPPGHDAWVVGDQTMIGIDMGSMIRTKAS